MTVIDNDNKAANVQVVSSDKVSYRCGNCYSDLSIGVDELHF